MKLSIFRTTLITSMAFVFLVGCARTKVMVVKQVEPVVQPKNGKIRIEKLDDLPRHTYTIREKASAMLTDKASSLVLARQVKKDLLNDLETYDIQDKTTLKDYYSTLATIAMIEDDYDTYGKYFEKRRELEDKEAVKLTSGLFTRSYIKAKKSSGNFQKNLRRNYQAMVEKLPYSVVEAELKSAKGRSEILSENLLSGMMDSKVQVIIDRNDGTVSKDIALTIIGSYYTYNNYLPYKQIVSDVLTEYLDKNKVEKKDIWADRDFSLTPDQSAEPAIAAVWDSGVDTHLFKGQLWTNQKEIPGNGIDDDGNGYIDDIHGIAYTLHSDKTPELLFPIGDVEADRPRLQRMMKGLTDLTSGVESEEAGELRQILSKLDQADVKPFIEDISRYGNYCHGTHVAGITANGNPFVRLLVSRITFGYTMIPEEPTIEQAEKDARATEEVIDYFKKNGVRVVNMSWGGDLASVESALEANNAGGTPEERKKLAREIFEITRESLFNAIKNAPGILFITSAGNADNDVTFEEMYPSSFDLPNIISVGAVDQAGDETDFTSFGKVDVYANGFEVLSYVPGGDKLKLSGTSMSSPNVTNLAAKLFALRPDLTPLQVRRLIEKGCDEKMAGDRLVKLINPKKSRELLKNL